MFMWLDSLLGRTMFVPLIIRICQAAGWTQYRFAAYAWLSFWLFAIYRIGLGGEGIGNLIAMILMASLSFWDIRRAAMKPDEPVPDHALVRYIWLFALCANVTFLVIDVVAYQFDSQTRQVVIHDLYRLVDDFLALAAVYAYTIKTIPPLADNTRKAVLASE